MIRKLIEDFEAPIVIINPDAQNDYEKYLWSEYPNDFTNGPDIGTVSLSKTEKVKGSQSIRVDITEGNLYLHFFPNFSGHHKYMREVLGGSDYELDTFTRMRFWMKVPKGVQMIGGGNANFNLGTYIRSTLGLTSSDEDNNGHYYHHYDLPGNDQWHLLEVDFHPNHQRGASGGTDIGVKEYPTNEPGYNYFDLLTRFYFDFKNKLEAPATFYLDSFELISDKRPNPINQVYSPNGYYDPKTNLVWIAWMRNKAENDVKHEIRYAFSDIYDLGWDNASFVEGNTLLKPLGWGGYNGMLWREWGLDLKNKDVLFIAIKPENADTFRQFELPLSASYVPTDPTTDPIPDPTTDPTGTDSEIVINLSIVIRGKDVTVVQS